MARTGPSAAEVELLAELERRGATASASQLERWRSAGIPPANVRTYLGPGRGSRSRTAEITLAIAEAMALVARPGRSVYETALRIFTVDPRHNDLFVYPGLRLPPGAIKTALSWYCERGDTSLNRRAERALHRYRDAPDEAARAVSRLTSDHYRALRRPRPAGVRYQPSSLKETDSRSAQADATMTLARFFGYQEVGGDRIASIIADEGRRFSGVSADDIWQAEQRLRNMFVSVELQGQEAVHFEPAPTSAQVAGQLAGIDEQMIYDLRDKLAFVSELGCMAWQLIGQDIGEPLVSRVLAAVRTSISAKMLFFAALPVADTLDSNGWRRMSSLTIMVLTDPAGEYQRTLDLLAAAAVPDRFGAG
jgi:hypothetical protein